MEMFYEDKVLGEDTSYLLLDMEKAFDRVDRGAMYRLLDHMAFHKEFIACIRALYSDTPVTLVGVKGSPKVPVKERSTTGLSPVTPLVHASNGATSKGHQDTGHQLKTTQNSHISLWNKLEIKMTQKQTTQESHITPGTVENHCGTS